MKLTIAAIGKMKSGPERDLLDRYLKRARAMGPQLGLSAINLNEYVEARDSNIDKRKHLEASQLCSSVVTQDPIIVLDERGDDISSNQFARLLARYRDEGYGSLNLLIGGPDGLDHDLVKKAQKRIRLGSMTWPHQLARIMLIEQIYRAMTILAGHPYHRQ